MTSYNDRVEGVLLGTAAGYVLGAPYEFQPPRGPELEVAMVGGGLWERGEWTDDTSMAIAIAEVAATGADLRDAAAQDAIVSRMAGMVTRHQRHWNPNGFGAEGRVARWPHHGGGGADCIGGPPPADGPHGGQRLAHAVPRRWRLPTSATRTPWWRPPVRSASWTHYDPDAGDACVLWCCAIRHAVLTGELDVRVGLRHIASDRRDLWTEASGCRRVSAARVLPQQRMGGDRDAGGMVGHRDDTGSGRRSCCWCVSGRPPTAGAGRRGPRRVRHRHGGGDRRQVRGVWSVGDSGPLAQGAARLAGYHGAWPRGAGDGDRAWRQARPLRLLVPGLPDRHLRTAPLPLSVFGLHAHAASPCGVWVVASPRPALRGRGLTDAPPAPGDPASAPWPVPTVWLARVPMGPWSRLDHNWRYPASHGDCAQRCGRGRRRHR